MISDGGWVWTQRLVIKTRSVEFMPLLLSVCVFLNSTVWTGYGIMAKDIFIMVSQSKQVPTVSTKFLLQVWQKLIYLFIWSNFLLSGVLWSAYNLDPQIPNGLGMLSGVAQLLLHAFYRNATPRPPGIGEAPTKGSVAAGSDIHMQTIYVPIEKDGKTYHSKVNKVPSATPRSTLAAGQEGAETN